MNQALKDMRTSGIVTLSNWTLMPNGQTYLHVWAKDMVVLTDSEIAKTLPGFRSAEKWTLVMYNLAGNIVVLIPGCQVKGWVFSDTAPKHPQCFDVSNL